MARIAPITFLIAMVALSAASASAQSLNPPATSSRPIVSGRSSVPSTARPTAIPSNPGQRSGAASLIPSTGPSTPRSATAPMKPVAPISPPEPVRARDENGRRIPGAVQVSPTRAYDPATGRYHQTTPGTSPR